MVTTVTSKRQLGGRAEVPRWEKRAEGLGRVCGEVIPAGMESCCGYSGTTLPPPVGWLSWDGLGML